MCIYYTKRTDLHYDSAEHIIPAALGGIATLPSEYVSKEFNTAISGLEQDFIREGWIAIPRPLLGPSKRGSLSERKATKSKVQVIRDVRDASRLALGYTALRKAYEIPHLLLNTVTGEGSFSCSRKEQPSIGQEELMLFKTQCIQANQLRIKMLEDATLPVDLILLGILEGIEENYNCFIVKNPANTAVLSKENLRRIGQGIQFDQNVQFCQYRPIIHQQVKFSPDHLRIYGKIAFNFLAWVTRPEIVRRPPFDAVRNWIVEGGEYPHVDLDPMNLNPLDGMEIAPPDNAHIIYLMKDQRRLVAKVFLYGGYSVTVGLTEDYPVDFDADGLICDWKKKKEYRLREFLAGYVDRVNERLKEKKVNPSA